MDVPPLSFLDIKDDRERLIGFLWWLQQFLELLVKESEHSTQDVPLFSPELPNELRKSIFEAWHELNDRRRTFDEVVKYQEKEVAATDLERAGLTGAQLSFKFRVLHWIRERFGARKSPGWLRRFLKAIDDILDSIAGVNPVAHGIKEFKEALSSLTGE